LDQSRKAGSDFRTELLVVKSIALASANYVHLLETSIPSHRPTSPQFQLNAFVGAVERVADD
jgi:hypothetical protein